MLTPIIIGVLFFVYSSISAYIAVRDTKIFENKTRANLEIGDYEIQQIDEKTNKLKWLLKAKLAEAQLDENRAKVTDPQLSYYDSPRGGFKVTAQIAYLDKVKNEILLEKDVKLITGDRQYNLSTGSLLFREDQPFIELNDNWHLLSTKGFSIEGEKGKVTKDFKSLTSMGASKLSQNKGEKPIDISASEIQLEMDSGKPITATGSAELKISATQNLRANKIIIFKDGEIKAKNSVVVTADNLKCFSEDLVIKPNADKSPKTAIFTIAPHLIQNNNIIYADSINYDFATKQATIEGNVHSKAL